MGSPLEPPPNLDWIEFDDELSPFLMAATAVLILFAGIALIIAGIAVLVIAGVF